MKERLGCPYCTGLKALAGYNDLATTHPMLAKDWDDARNGELTPQMVTAGSRKRYTDGKLPFATEPEEKTDVKYVNHR